MRYLLAVEAPGAVRYVLGLVVMLVGVVSLALDAESLSEPCPAAASHTSRQQSRQSAFVAIRAPPAAAEARWSQYLMEMISQGRVVSSICTGAAPDICFSEAKGAKALAHIRPYQI